MTYGDGLANIDIARGDRLSYRTRPQGDGGLRAPAGALRPRGRSRARRPLRSRKSRTAEGGLINGGFFVSIPACSS